MKCNIAISVPVIPLDAFYYSIAVSLSWSKPKVSGSLPLASDGHAACIRDDTMFIHGGFVERIGQFTLSLHALNLETLIWKEMPQTVSCFWQSSLEI